MRGAATTTMTRWLVWIPVLMVGSLIYWTVALGLGGMSLMEVSSLSANDGALGLSSSSGDIDSATVTPPRDGYEPIIVHLEESVEPEDVDDNAGCGLSGGESAGGGAADHAAPLLGRGDAVPVVVY